MITRITGAVTLISFVSASLAALIFASFAHSDRPATVLAWFTFFLMCEGILLFGVFERRSPIFGPIFWRGRSGSNLVALTFDDGPNEPFTSRILDVLKDRGVRATFFLIGSNCLRFPETVERLAREGHETGNHTWSHEVIPLKSRSRIEEEIRKTSGVIEKFAGKAPVLFRAPHGWRNPWTNAAARKCGCVPVAWTLGVWDTDRPGAEVIARRTLKGVRGGCVVLLHDGRGVEETADSGQLVDALPFIIDEIRRRGFHLVALSELMETTR